MVALTLGGRVYDVRPDFARLVALEQAFGQPFFAIAEMFIEGNAPLNALVEAVTIITSYAPGKESDLGRELVVAGIASVMRALQDYFLAALGIGNEAGADRE
jgi:Phage tail tube protein, GTA-gp10